jgi:hypothetical protein
MSGIGGSAHFNRKRNGVCKWPESDMAEPLARQQQTASMVNSVVDRIGPAVVRVECPLLWRWKYRP